MDEKLLTNASDLTNKLAWGWDAILPSWAGSEAHTSLQHGHGSQIRGKHSLKKNGLLFLKGKQTGVLVQILWFGCRQTKHGNFTPFHIVH